MVFIQERFDIIVDDLDLVPEHFASVDTICAYLRSQIGKGAGQVGSRRVRRARGQAPPPGQAAAQSGEPCLLAGRGAAGGIPAGEPRIPCRLLEG